MFHTFLALNPWIYPYVQSNIWAWRLFGGDRPCRQRRKFLHKKTSSYPPKSILQGRSKGWSKMKLKRPPSVSSSINFPLKKKNPSIRLFERSDMFFLTKKHTKTPHHHFEGQLFLGSRKMCFVEMLLPLHLYFKPWKRRVIWVDRRMLFLLVCYAGDHEIIKITLPPN